MSIVRYSLRSTVGADRPQLRVDLNAQQALGRILNRRAWWTASLADKRQWIDALGDDLVRTNLRQALSVWNQQRTNDWVNDWALNFTAQTVVDASDKCAVIDSAFLSLIERIQRSSAFSVGVEDPDDPDGAWDRQWDGSVSSSDEEEEAYEGSDDSGDEFALDNDDNVVPIDVAVAEATAWLRLQRREVEEEEEQKDESVDEDDEVAERYGWQNPFGQVTWFACFMMMRDQLLALEDVRLENVARILQAVPTHDNEEAIARALSLIDAVVHAEDPTVEMVTALVPQGTPDDAVRMMHFHLTAIRTLVEETKEDVTMALDIIQRQLGLFPKEEGGEGDVTVPIPGPIPMTWMRGECVSIDLKTKFQSEIVELRRSGAEPPSPGRLAHLVDPSLYCAVVDVTKYRTSQLPPTFPPETPMQHMIKLLASPSDSLRTLTRGPSQWLPCQVHVDESGNATIRTYINNLHPATFAGMYQSMGQIFSRFDPLFENVVSAMEQSADHRTLLGLYEINGCTLPRAPRLVPRGLFDADRPQFPLKGKQCHVVVRLSEIQLTPENPVFQGEAWHNEGSDEELIVATGVYFFNVQNVADPKLSFRTFVQYPYVKPDDDVTLKLAYGFNGRDVLAQELGNISAVEDRCVVFPNWYQSKLESFSLADSSKPGSLGMLTFMLVAPMSTPVLSTATVPPQQADWIQQLHTPLVRQLQLPETVETLVQDFALDGISLEQAIANREQLIRERTRAVQETDYVWYQRSENASDCARDRHEDPPFTDQATIVQQPRDDRLCYCDYSLSVLSGDGSIEAVKSIVPFAITADAVAILYVHYQSIRSLVMETKGDVDDVTRPGVVPLTWMRDIDLSTEQHAIMDAELTHLRQSAQKTSRRGNRRL